MARKRQPTAEEFLRSFDRGDEWVSPRQRAMQEQESAEEPRRGSTFDNVESGGPDFNNVRGSSSTVAPPSAGRTSLDMIPTALAGAVNRMARDQLYLDRDYEAVNAAREKKIALDRVPDWMQKDISNAFGMREAWAKSESLEKALTDVTQQAAVRDAKVDAEVKDMMAKNPIRGYLERGVLDVMRSPESALSVFGGPTAIIPGVTSYAGEYRAAREEGVDPASAAERAKIMAGIEGGISAIPAGRLFAGGTKKIIRSRLEDIGRGIVRTSAGEFVEEAATELAQDSVDQVGKYTNDTKVGREFAAAASSKTHVELLENVLRAGTAGAFGGAAMGTPQVMMEAAAEQGKLAAKFTQTLNDQVTKRADDRKQSNAIPLPDQRQQDEMEAAYRTRDLQREAEEQAKLELADPFTPDGAQLEPAPVTPVTAEQVARERLMNRKPETPEEIAFAQRNAQTGMGATKAGKGSRRKPAGPPKGVQELAAALQELNPDMTPEAARADASKQLGATLTSDLETIEAFAKSPEAQARPEVAATAQLAAHIKRNLGNKDARRLATLVANDQAEIVDSLADIGVEEDPRGPTMGFYSKDGRLYINASAINGSQNILEAVAMTVPHEVKHAADYTSGVTYPKSISTFIGLQNMEPINDKIRAASARGNKTAMKAMRGANGDPTEIIPHFISQTQLDAKKTMGLGGVVKDIQAAVTGAARTFGLVDDVPTLGEIYSLSNKLTDYVALTPNSIAKPGDGTISEEEARAGNRMVVSAESPTGVRLRGEGVPMYQDVDSAQKVISSDADSRLIATPLHQRKLKDGATLRVGDLLDNPTINESYPEFLGMPVMKENAIGGYAAMSEDQDTGDLTLLLGDKSIDDMRDDPSSFHSTLLHELQHSIQSVENFAKGGSPEQFLPDDYATKVKGLELARKNFTNTLIKLHGLVHKKGPSRELAALEELVLASDDDRTDPAGIMREVAALMDSYYVEGADPILDKAKSLAVPASRLHIVTRNMMDDAKQKYYALRGEQESRFVEENRLKTQAELPASVPVAANTLIGLDVGGPTIQAKNEGKRMVSSNATIVGAQKRGSDLGKLVRSALTTTEGLGKAGRAISEEAVGEAAYIDDLGLQAGGRLQYAIKTKAKEMVTSGQAPNFTAAFKQVNDLLHRKISALEMMPTEAARKAALASIVRNNPEFAELQNVYKLINDLTRQLVRQQIASANGPLTPKDQAKIKTMIENQTRYLTRSFALFQGRQGKKWADRMLNEVKAAEAALAQGKTLPPKYADSLRRYKDGLNYIIQNDVAVFDRNDLDQKEIDSLRQIYDTWHDPAAREGLEAQAAQGLRSTAAIDAKRQFLIDAIVTKGGQVGAAEITKRAENIVHEILGGNDSGNPVASHYRGFKQDRSILMERAEVPKEIRELMGEITDPTVRVMTTVFRQGELIARTNMLLKLKNEEYGSLIVSNEDQPTSDPKFNKQLQGEAWGPLEGYWVPEGVFNVIKDSSELATNMEDALGRAVIDPNPATNRFLTLAGKALTKAAGWQKLLAIVWNPMQMVWNAVGSPIMGIANGNLNAKSYWRALKVAGRMLAKELKTAGNWGDPTINSPDQKLVIKYDMMDSAQMGELRTLPQKHVRDLIKNRGRVTQAMVNGRDMASTLVRQLFALSDLIVKWANFFARIDVLNEFYEATGEQKTEDEINREAADTIKDTNITFRRAAPIVKIAERAGGTYVMPYIQGVFRSIGYNVVVGYDDITRGLKAPNPKARDIMLRQGLQRISGTGIAVFGLTAIAGSMLGGDEEKDAKIRRLMMPDARYGQNIYVGNDDKGNALMLRIGRFDPLGPATDITRIVYGNGTNEQKLHDVGEHFKDLWIKPRLTQSAALAIGEMLTPKFTATKQKETKTERIFPGASLTIKAAIKGMPGMDGDDAEAIIGLLDTGMPGVSNIIDPNNRKPVDYKGGVPFEQVAAFMTHFGGKLDVIDPAQAARGAAFELGAARKAARKQFFENARLTDNPTRDAVIGMLDGMTEERKAFVRMEEVYQGIIAMGKTKDQADEMLKDAKVSKADRELLRSGKYSTDLNKWGTEGSSVVSKKSIDEYLSNSEKYNSKEKSEKDKEALKEAVRIARELGYDVQGD